MNRKQKMKAALDSLFTSPKTEEARFEELPVVSEAKTEEVFVKTAQSDVISGHNGSRPIEAPQNGQEEVFIEEQLAQITEAMPVSTPAVVKEPDQPVKTSEVPARPAEEATTQVERHLVVFQLCDEYYGVDISLVEGIIKMQPITIVPHTPSYVQGVTNLRGTVLPVFDLRKRFGLEAKSLTKDSRIVVVRNHGNSLGMIVDSVAEVLRVPAKACEPAPKIVSTVDSTYISGIARTEDQLVILLDLDRVLRLKPQGNGI